MAYADAWDSADPHTRRAWSAIRKMKTEDDVQRVEELLLSKPPRDFRGPLEINAMLRWLKQNPILLALQKKDAHETRTGHKVRWGSE